MGIADGIDRLLRTLRSSAAAPAAVPVRDASAGPPAAPSQNGRPTAAEPAPTAPEATPGDDSPPEASSSPPADTLTGALAARVEEAYQSHREAEAGTVEPPAAATDTPGHDLVAAPASAQAERPPSEPPEEVIEETETTAPTAVDELPFAVDRPGDAVDIVVLPPVIEEAGAFGGEIALEPGPPMTSASLHADSIARLEAASGIAESLGLGFHLGGAVERIAYGASRGRDGVDALREATWLIERYVALVEQRPVGADLHASAVRLGRSGDAIAEIRALTAALDASRETRLAALGPPAHPRHPDTTGGATTSDAPTSDPPEREGAPKAVPEPEHERESFSREVALMAARWAIMVVAVIAVVLAVTLIGEWV